MNHTKIKIICVSLACAVLLTGSIFKQVNIYTSNGKPLIDLDELIEGSTIGQPGDPSEVQDPTTEEKEETKEQPAVVKPEYTAPPTAVRVQDKIINIHGKRFEYDRKIEAVKAEQQAEFEQELAGLKGSRVKLVDAYAEYHAYVWLRERLVEAVGAANLEQQFVGNTIELSSADNMPEAVTDVQMTEGNVTEHAYAARGTVPEGGQSK